VQHDAAGNRFAFHGVYHEVKAPDMVVDTFEFEGMPGHVSMETAIFGDIGGKTKFTEKSVFQSVADRDMMIQSGMEEGMDETMDRLAELLRELQKGKFEKIEHARNIWPGYKEDYYGEPEFDNDRV
jgi:uncharacterized protein YndB with AHSA1/START domain